LGPVLALIGDAVLVDEPAHWTVGADVGSGVAAEGAELSAALGGTEMLGVLEPRRAVDVAVGSADAGGLVGAGALGGADMPDGEGLFDADGAPEGVGPPVGVGLLSGGGVVSGPSTAAQAVCSLAMAAWTAATNWSAVAVLAVALA